MNELYVSTRDRRLQLERLRGMVDVSPEMFYRQQQVHHLLNLSLSRYGYRQVETPIIEPTELFLRKSGGERVAQMYAFHYRDREIALRPEHTASLLRMYADSMQSEPLPLRLSYSGPVFRYEKPQAGRTRQFTEVGCELLGGSGAAADSEVIHVALNALSAVGIEGQLVLGHVGIVLDFLNRLPLRQRARDWLLWSMERLRKGQAVDVEADLAGLVSGDQLSTIFDEMSATFRDIPASQLEGWVLAVLHEVGVQMQGGSRSPEEIVSGVIAKMSRHSDEPDVRSAFEFLRELASIQGSAASVIPDLRVLAQRHGLHDEPINQIERVLELLAAYGHSIESIELHPGLGRGLHYYTGMLFEVYTSGRQRTQLCGGGRYDDLAQLLGARQPLPACGFSFGLERVMEASQIGERPAFIDALVVPATADALPAAIQVAEQLRAQDAVVELDVRGRSIHANRRFALRAGIMKIVVVHADGEVDTEELVETAGDPQQAANLSRGRSDD